MSDVVATTQAVEGAAGQESAFQSFWDASNDSAERPREEGQQATESGQEAAQQAVETDNGQTDQQTQEADDAPQYASLNDLLTAHKIDPESVMGLHVTAKIDGKETQVPLSDVLKSYQLEGHVNNKSIELSTQKAQFDQERQAARNLFQQQIQQNTALGNLAMQQLTHEYQRIDWNGLRANNPAEFAALNAEFQQRQGQIQQYLQAVNQAGADEAARQQHELQNAIQGEREKLYNAIPDWRNEETFTKARDVIGKYARSLGFQDAELNQIFDHRYMRVLHDAARYQELQAATPQALKQVRQAPLMAKPGSRVDVNPNAAKRQQAIERFNRNPRDQDAQAAAFEFFANQGA